MAWAGHFRPKRDGCHGGPWPGCGNNFMTKTAHPPRCDGYHISRFSFVSKRLWPGGWSYQLLSLPYCPARLCERGLFSSDHSQAMVITDDAPVAETSCPEATTIERQKKGTPSSDAWGPPEVITSTLGLWPDDWGFGGWGVAAQTTSGASHFMRRGFPPTRYDRLCQSLAVSRRLGLSRSWTPAMSCATPARRRPSWGTS